MDTIDFTDPKAREEYFQLAYGRPTDAEIAKAIREMVAVVGPHAGPDDGFISNDLCLSIWDEYPNQHVYIGIRVSKLEDSENKLPIRRIATINRRAVYAIA